MSTTAHLTPQRLAWPPATVRASAPTQPRQPALPGYLARRLLRMLNPPVVGSRAHLVETCRAEVDWSIADWKRCNPGWNGWDDDAALIAQAHRLPHERAAARVVNSHGHMDTAEYMIRKAVRRHDPETAAAYLPRLKRALVAYRKAGRDYRRLRNEIDAPTGAPCMKEAA